MSSSDFTQRRRQEHQVQAAAGAEEVQHGSHGQAKDGQAETADEMLDRLLDEMKTPGQEQGEKSGTRSPDSTRRSSIEREVGEGVKALTGAGEKGAQKPVAALQAGAGEKKAQKPAVVEEVARPVSLPPEQPPGLEVVQGKGQGGLLSGLTPGVSSLTLSGVPMGNAPTLARMSETARNPPVVENRADGHGGGCQHQNENGGGTAATETTVALLERPGSTS